MKAAITGAVKAAATYLLTNKKARALEYTLLLGLVEAVRSALGFGA